MRFVPVEVAGKSSRSTLLHREDCFQLRDAEWPEPLLREATDEELRSRPRCQSCLKRERRSSRPDVEVWRARSS